jgi:hypothetical protein
MVKVMEMANTITESKPFMIMEGNRVNNVVLAFSADDVFLDKGQTIEPLKSGAGPGLVRQADGRFIDPNPSIGPIEPSVPANISPRQLILGLLSAGLISADEALAAAKGGVMPAAVAAVVQSLPADKRTVAEVTWARMTVVERSDPLVGLLAQSAGKTEEDINQYFIDWSKL